MEQSATSILLACLGYANEAAKAEQLANVTPGQWQMVAELARQHGVAALLYHDLQPLWSAMPDEVADELKQKYRQNVQRNFRLYLWLGKILQVLNAKNIAVLVLKGSYLADAVYDNVGLRTMGDVDLLVKRDHLLRVEEELLALGFMPEEYSRVITEENHHFLYKLPGTGLLVEIHWAILDSSYSSNIDMDGLWSRARPVMLAQSPALAFSPEDLLLYLCLHIANHVDNMRIRMLCDIGEVVRYFGTELDWEEISTRARQWGKARAVYVVSRLAQELLGVVVPADWLASLLPESFDDRYFKLAREQVLADCSRLEGTLLESSYLARLQGSKELGRKLALILDRLLPSRETMALQYPAPATSWRIYLYYPARIKYVLIQHGATLWRMIRGDPKTRIAAERTNQITALRDWLMSK